ncbi:MAG: aminotransferase class III-fold pyridoxal phosphate-dependent enzyme, partial [Gammaproteobacteria bacterium]|nr:aminotransferase class III-fold pyridoxal phosphate-dependent enzyme [Gammaproteobacteria bacterium]
MTQRLHNVAEPGSPEARDLDSLLHPNTNLLLHERNGPMVMESAKGVIVRDRHGKEYIEAMGGLWCTALGYGDEEVVEAAAESLRKMSYGHLFGSKSHE